MSRNDNYDSVSAYHDAENQRRHIEHENEWAHSEAGLYEIRYNDAREEEILQREAEYQMRFNEILGNLEKLYLSKRGIIILVIAAILATLSFGLTNFILGFVCWNVLIVVVLWIYFLTTAKIQIKTIVRPEINDRTYFIQQSAREKAYRK
jgi:hypothetical protein